MEDSVLDVIGNEVTGVVAPVSVCMALTVALVRILNPEGASQSGAVLIASIAYDEQAHQGDSPGQKLGGALLNAVIFACIMGAMTVVLFLLFKYRCYRVIYAYLGFAVFNIYFFMFGTVSLLLLQKAGIHIDAFSFMFLLFNFSVVGMLATFFVTAPLLLRQMYLVVIGVKVAYIFTLIPEWTSWVLLVVMAVYDIIVVLCPGGPLKALVDLAVDRGEELPALVYEARPQGRYQRGNWAGRQGSQLPSQPGTPNEEAQARQPGPVGEGMETFHIDTTLASTGLPISATLPTSLTLPLPGMASPGGSDLAGSSSAGGPAATAGGQPSGTPAQGSRTSGRRGSGGSGGSAAAAAGPGPMDRVLGWLTAQQDIESGGGGRGGGGGGGRSGQGRPAAGSGPPVERLNSEQSETASVASDAPLMEAGAHSSDGSPSSRARRRRNGNPDGGESPGHPWRSPLSAPLNTPHPPANPSADPPDPLDVGLPDGIKLGMGDFIFYSMLVGRAAMFDMMTVFASYLAIVAGLGATLLLLAVARRALPALPISIALGVVFYFLTRLVLEPFVLPMLMNYVAF